MSRTDRFYLFVVVLLIIAAAAGGIRLAMQQSGSQPVEIILSQAESARYTGNIYISGAVASPSIYPWQEGDTIQALLLDAGLEPDADLSNVKLHIPPEGEAVAPQKIDINRAEPWLLQALPGIGEVRAQAIVGYRDEHGPFGIVEDLLKVSGIGPTTLDRIRDYITVSD
ncbi:MAG: ComEA family DNA-binding protein [Dehalococcoidia bacterium]|nr:ComEA family DNA-binding protein [Dehalococcoidia bacterium]